jgi:hypothetical protein
MIAGEYVYAVAMTVVIVWLVAEVSGRDIRSPQRGPFKEFKPGRE